MATSLKKKTTRAMVRKPKTQAVKSVPARKTVRKPKARAVTPTPAPASAVSLEEAKPTLTVLPMKEPKAKSPVVPLEETNPMSPVVPPEETEPTPPVISLENQYKMIQEAAYLLAERDGFKKDPNAYWVEAEAAIYVQIGLKK